MVKSKETNRRKGKNMKKKKIITSLISLVCLLSLTACSYNDNSKTVENKNSNDIETTSKNTKTKNKEQDEELKKYVSPMVCIYDQGYSLCEKIFVDKETKCMYLFEKTNYSGGLTQLTNADGSPKLFDGDLSEYENYSFSED